jgi:ferredoxin-NADP reductase
VLDKADPSKPLVLLSAGVGITPIIAMLDEELSYPRSRSKWCFHQIRDLENAPLVAEMIQRVESSKNCLATIAISQLDHTPRCSSKRVALLPGKLDVENIVKQVGTCDFHVLMCGPEPWMQSVREALVANQVPDSQIHDESFGGSDSPVVTQDAPAADNAPEPSAPAFSVTYESSGKIATYQSSKSNLLAHAKKSGILLPASCRAGHCGTCAVKLLRGKVQYLRPPEAEIADDEILPCICTPASDLTVQA